MKTLKLYVVSSHVDKPLKVKIENSKYEVPIQAGAALTEKRICEVNDYDGFFESPRFFYIPRYEYQDVVKKELKSAETSSQIETIHRRYKSHRFDASRFNNGYYWIDNLNNGDKITTKPENPVRIGYTFAGWCLDKEGTQEFDFDTFVKSDEDLVLYAKWIKNN